MAFKGVVFVIRIVKGFSNVLGSHKNDTIHGDEENNVLLGLEGDDSIKGEAGDDKILTGDGDDHIQGGAGDDKIDGGEGTDTAVFSGNKSDYTVKRTKDIVTVHDQRKENHEGTDQIENVETFQFNDFKIKIKELNEGPKLKGGEKSPPWAQKLKGWRGVPP